MNKNYLLATTMLFVANILFAQGLLFSENPVAFQYQLKHFGLKGKAKSVKLYGASGQLMVEENFAPDVRSLSSISYSSFARRLDYQYDDTKKLITVTDHSRNLHALKFLYEVNKKSCDWQYFFTNSPVRETGV